MYRSAQRTGRMTTSSVEIDVSFIKSRWRYSSSETADTWSLPNQESERCKSARTVTCVPPSEPNRHGRKIMQTRPRTRAQVLTPTAGNDFFFFVTKISSALRLCIIDIIQAVHFGRLLVFLQLRRSLLVLGNRKETTKPQRSSFLLLYGTDEIIIPSFSKAQVA